MHQDRLTGPDVQRIGEGLVGGERRDGPHRGGVNRHPRRDQGNVPSGGDELLRPAALLAQRQRMRGHHVADADPVDRVADRGDEPGRLHTQRHRRMGAGIPAAGANKLIPVTYPAGLDVDFHLVGP